MCKKVGQAMKLEQFNTAPRSQAIDTLSPCVDVVRWCEQIVDSRPLSTRDALLATALAAALPFTSLEVAVALSHHPRIGQHPVRDDREAAMARSGQAGVDHTDEAIATGLAIGNRAYEQKFGRVFLIRAAGRTGEQMLASLHERLRNTATTEDRTVAEQLREIAILR
jgi:2-oxo-4-hydroxy-4-carboxy-5-ureidoimidazoline decarboxylase